ncbi:two-component system sensor histidine kinase/response regulator [Oxalobacteraceae bacterium GrIS 1.11]
MFKRAPTARQLTITSMRSTCGVLLLLAFACGATSVLNRKQDEIKQLSALATLIGKHNVDALLLAKPRLARLAAPDDILQAALFDHEGKLFALYQAERGRKLDPPAVTHLVGDEAASEFGGPFWAPSLRVYRPVKLQGEVLGGVLIEADLRPVAFELMGRLAAILGATIVCFGVALALTALGRKRIAKPIASLTEAARMLSSKQACPGRIDYRRSDELGALIDGFNAMLEQITSRDATLANYRDQLERQVGLRTAQLEKAKNAAEAASRAKSAFLATMSHEIRTPMNGVLGMTELLLASKLTEQQRHYTEMVKRSGENLLVIINDILDFSKIEAGKLSVEYIHFNFRELLDDLEHVFAPQANAKGLALEFAIANHIPIAICGDPNRLRQVLVNLIGNAIKFTEAGRITVKVAVDSETEQAVQLRLEVHDTGIGVASEAQERIFDSFSQADGSTTRKHGGTGLGLAISKQLVELMGGKIGVDNALTQGSIFWFTVNFDKHRVDFDDPSFNPKTTQGLHALIIDEHCSSRDVLERQLAAWRIASDSASSADDALLRLRDAARRGQPYTVALIDMELSRTSGLALAATIKAEPAIAGIKLLLLSSEQRAADSVQRREAGVAFQLIKPARECDLFDCIVTRLRASEGVRSAAPAARVLLAPKARRKVLLAEDNPVNIEVAKAMLDSLGLEVRCAHDGEQALRAAQGEDFDLVLMDCQMPVMDGFAATAEIRRHELQGGRSRVLPIIAITANALQGDREACLAAGMDDYLSKPFTQQQLAHTIARWIPLPRAATVHHDEAAPPAAPRNIINRHALDNIRALSATGGAALLQRVIHAYVDDTPQHLHSLRLAIEALNAGGIRKSAHSLKSSSANVGADALAQLCKEMEKLGRADSTEGASGILTDMEQEFLAVRHSLSAILEKEI